MQRQRHDGSELVVNTASLSCLFPLKPMALWNLRPVESGRSMPPVLLELVPAPQRLSVIDEGEAAAEVRRRGYELKVGEVSRGRFEARIRDLIEGHDMLETVIGPMLRARVALWHEFTRLDASKNGGSCPPAAS
jgi:hypothetical protein